MLPRLHHVNEIAPRDQWIYWDVGFLIWGAVMLAFGWKLFCAAVRKALASDRNTDQPFVPMIFA